VIVSVMIAVALVTIGVLIILAKSLFRSAPRVTETAGQAASLTISLLPDDGEDGGPLTPNALLTISLLPDRPR